MAEDIIFPGLEKRYLALPKWSLALLTYIYPIIVMENEDYMFPF